MEQSVAPEVTQFYEVTIIIYKVPRSFQYSFDFLCPQNFNLQYSSFFQI